MVQVKICGLTNFEDASKACEYGADYIGFVFTEQSPRTVVPDVAKDIITRLQDGPEKVGLFKDDDMTQVRETVRYCALDFVQLHGAESPDYCIDSGWNCTPQISISLCLRAIISSWLVHAISSSGSFNVPGSTSSEW